MKPLFTTLTALILFSQPTISFAIQYDKSNPRSANLEIEGGSVLLMELDPSPEERARMLDAATAEPSSSGFAALDHASVRALFPSVKNQKTRGTCTVFSTMALIDFNASKVYSEQCLAYHSDSQDTSTVQRRLYWAKENGVVLEKECPYLDQNENELTRDDLPTLFKNHWSDQPIEVPHGVVVRQSIDDYGDSIVFIRKAIRAGLPVAVQMTIFTDDTPEKSRESWNFGNKKPTPLNAIITAPPAEIVSRCDHWPLIHRLKENAFCGSHAVVVTGFDDATQSLEIRNSWGTNWRDHGYARLSYNYFKHFATDDMMVFDPDGRMGTAVDPMDAVVNFKNAVDRSYVPFVGQAVQNQLNHYFLWRKLDFLKSLEAVNLRANESLRLMEQARADYYSLSDQVRQKKMPADVGAFLLSHLSRSVDLETRKIELLISDARKNAATWSNRCAPATLEYPKRYYSPQAWFPPPEEAFNPSKQGVDANQSIGACGIENGRQEILTLENPKFVAKCGAAFIAHHVASSIGSVVRGVKNLFGSSPTYWQYVAEIRRTMLRAADAEQAGEVSRMTNTCNEILSDSLDGSSTISAAFMQSVQTMSTQLSFGQSLQATLNTEFNGISQAIQLDLAAKNREYYEAAAAADLKSIENYRERQILLDGQTREFARGPLGALAARVSQLHLPGATEPAAVVAEAEDRLLTQIIEGDLRLNSESSVLPKNGRTLWSMILKTLRKEFSK